MFIQIYLHFAIRYVLSFIIHFSKKNIHLTERPVAPKSEFSNNFATVRPPLSQNTTIPSSARRFSLYGITRQNFSPSRYTRKPLLGMIIVFLAISTDHVLLSFTRQSSRFENKVLIVSGLAYRGTTLLLSHSRDTIPIFKGTLYSLQNLITSIHVVTDNTTTIVIETGSMAHKCLLGNIPIIYSFF